MIYEDKILSSVLNLDEDAGDIGLEEGGEEEEKKETPETEEPEEEEEGLE